MSEDIKKILKMVQDGKITADEADLLIESIQSKSNDKSVAKRSKSIKIYVYNKIKDKKEVDVTIPLVLAKSFLKFGLKFVPKDSIKVGDANFDDVNFDDLIKAIEEGAEGTLVDVDEDDQRVVIKVE